MLFSSDTTPDARRVLLAIIKGQAPERRLAIALAAGEAMRGMIRADLRDRFPGEGEAKLHARFLARWLGPELAEQVLAHRAAHPRPGDSST